MNIEIVEYKETDTIMVTHNIGAMSVADVDPYCEKIMEKLKGVFGPATVVFFPVRESDETWDFKLIRQAS